MTEPSFSQALETHADGFIADAQKILNRLDRAAIDAVTQRLLAVREGGGRLFFLGVGGSAANCGHAVNDFRKIGGFEAYAPTDNVAELTARTNDEGWETVFAEWLEGSRIGAKDAVFVFSVGGGDRERGVSANLCRALDVAKTAGAQILGVVGRDGGYTAQMADACVIIPAVNPESVTPQSEAFQGVVWHLIVTDPRIKLQAGKWESVAGAR